MSNCHSCTLTTLSQFTDRTANIKVSTGCNPTTPTPKINFFIDSRSHSVSLLSAKDNGMIALISVARQTLPFGQMNLSISYIQRK